MRLIDIVDHVKTLTGGALYAVVGGLAQILWARKSHTDDLDVALAASDLARALERVRSGSAGRSWSMPETPDVAHEADHVFEVAHLLHDGAVVDLLSFRNGEFNAEILATAREVDELGGARFIRPELLLVTHLLRPGPVAALAAIELVIAHRSRRDLDLDYARVWAERVERAERLTRVLAQAAAFDVL